MRVFAVETVWKILRFRVFTAVPMKNSVFWDVTPCGSCKNRRFRGKYLFHHQGDKNRRTRNNVISNYQPKYYARSVLRLFVTTNFVPSSPILVTLMMEGMHSSETSTITRSTLRNVPEDDMSLA
jgi:hypothetical protein